MRGSWPIAPIYQQSIKTNLPNPFYLFFSNPSTLLFGCLPARSSAILGGLPILEEPPRASSRPIFPEGVLEHYPAKNELYVGLVDLKIGLTDYAASLAVFRSFAISWASKTLRVLARINSYVNNLHA